MIVTCHSPNFLPGASVVTKILAADVVAWNDVSRYTRGYENRNRLPNGKWLTVPVAAGSVGQPLGEVLICEQQRGWRDRAAADVRRWWGMSDVADVILEAGPRLVDLNLALLDMLLPRLGFAGRTLLQSEVGADGREPPSDRISKVVSGLGGCVYLSGPSGRRYLDEAPFGRLGVGVRYWEHAGPNPCVLDLIRDRQAVAA